MRDGKPKTPPPARVTPQIRLNSGQHDPFAGWSEDGTPRRVPGLRLSTRSLIPRSLQSSTQSGDPIFQGPFEVAATESTEHLLPPSSQSIRLTSDDRLSATSQTSLISPNSSASSRTSLDSDVGSHVTQNSRYPLEPFGDSRASSRIDINENEINTQTVSEKYNIMPSEELLLYPEDVEKDDYLHNPDPNELDRDCDLRNSRALANIGGLAFLTVGILALFIVYPVASFVRKLETAKLSPCARDPMCMNAKLPLLKNIRTGLIDPDTPESAKTMAAIDGKEWQLVFSDEFNTDGRTFYDGDDPYFQGVDLWYGGTQDIEWYDPDALTTKNGVLEIRFDAYDNHDLRYRSGMLQSWNRMCFKGGRLEASISLPGRGDTSGFWPGFWAMGNLGRPGYQATTDGMWPYSYWDVCDVGITANQSSTDGLSYLPGMRLPACTCPGQDHPTPGKSRSAPEIDVIEASVTMLNTEKGYEIGVASQSLQIAPFDVWYMPDYDYVAMYDRQISSINSYRGGPYQQAISGLTNLNNDWYDGYQYQKYAFEYTPGASGNVTWFVGDQKTWTVDGRSIGPNGNVGQRVIPLEPMAVVVNFGMSNSFAPLNLTGLTKLLPATMRVDYIRIYQDPDDLMVTCDPPGYETTTYIEDHLEVYTNPNITRWSPHYGWPTNSYVQGCGS